MSQRTVTTSSTPEIVFVDNRRFNQALDAILDFDNKNEGTNNTRDAFFALIEGQNVLENKDDNDKEVFTIHLDKLKPAAKLTITRALSIPEDKGTVQIAKEADASFRSFMQAVNIFFRETEAEIIDPDWIFYEPSDDITKQPACTKFFEDSYECMEESFKILQKAMKGKSEEERKNTQGKFELADAAYRKAKKEESLIQVYEIAENFISLCEKKVKDLTQEWKVAGGETKKQLEEKLENIKKEKEKLAGIKEGFKSVHFDLTLDRKLAGTASGAEYSSYGASLLDRVKYEGVVGKMLVTSITDFLNNPLTEAQEEIKLAELLKELSNVSDYNHVRVQIRKKQYDESLYKRLKESLETLGELLGADEDDPLFQFSTKSNCISPLMKSLQSIRVQRSINKVFEDADVSTLPFAAVAEVKASADDIQKYKLDKLPVVRPPTVVAAREWLKSSTPDIAQNRERLMKFMFDGADARFDSRNQIKLAPVSYLKTLVSADGNHYIVKGEDLANIDTPKKDGPVEITTHAHKYETFKDGTPMPPITTMHYRRSETEKYSCTEKFDVNGNLHVELTSPVTLANQQPEAAALEFARRLQRQVLFSAPPGYSDADRLTYLATFPIEITESPEDIPFKMMKEQLEKVGFGRGYISYPMPDRSLSANLGGPPVDTPSRRSSM